MVETRKPPSERDVIEWLRAGRLELPPLRFRVVRPQQPVDRGTRWDLVVEARWRDEEARFAVECRAVSTPKVFDESVRRISNSFLPPGCLPMLVMPYLGDSQLAELEQRGLSGIDLCGNGVVIVPDKLSVYRTGAKNKFPSYSPIRNVYRKNTSMVGRTLLAKPWYDEVQELRDEVNTRNPLVARWGKKAMSLSTVSKALKGMEDDLIVDRSDGIRLLQPDKLLEQLNLNYELPWITSSTTLKVDCASQQLLRLLQEKSEQTMSPIVATGLSSVSRYAIMQRDDVLSVYCPRVAALTAELPAREDQRFPNLRLIETEEQSAFFDAREEDGFLWASPTQTYLELMVGDKRDRETAEQVRSYVLNRMGENN